MILFNSNSNKKRKEKKRLTVNQWMKAHPLVPGTPVYIATGVLISSLIATSCTTGYAVIYNDTEIATTKSAATAKTAVTSSEHIISTVLNKDYDLNDSVKIKKKIVQKDRLENTEEATEDILEAVPDIKKAKALKVDNETIGVVSDGDSSKINEAIDSIKEDYKKETTVDVSVSNTVAVVEEYVPSDTKPSTEKMLEDGLREESLQQFIYTTSTGDSIQSILDEWGMSIDQLIKLNQGMRLSLDAYDDISSEDIEITPDEADNLNEEEVFAENLEEFQKTLPDFEPPCIVINEDILAYDPGSSEANSTEDEMLGYLLAPDQAIVVEQMSSKLIVTTVEQEEISRVVEPERLILLDTTIPVGEEKVLVEGKAGEEVALVETIFQNGSKIAQRDVETTVVTEAEPELVAVGYGEASQDIGTSSGTYSPENYAAENNVSNFMFQWPVKGRISSDFGYRYIFGGNNFHGGIDIPAPMGTAVHAGASGKVIFTGYKGTYGNLVIIDHGNGLQSYYAHNSAFLVKAGDIVTRGQAIAAVGSTGRSTGPHCHFEVRLNGNRVDPLYYLPGENNAPMRQKADLSTAVVPPEEKKEAVVKEEPEKTEPVVTKEGEKKIEETVQPETDAEKKDSEKKEAEQTEELQKEEDTATTEELIEESPKDPQGTEEQPENPVQENKETTSEPSKEESGEELTVQKSDSNSKTKLESDLPHNVQSDVSQQIQSEASVSEVAE